MAIKDLIARGIGFTPGGVNFIVTHGLSSAEPPPPPLLWTPKPDAPAATWAPKAKPSTTWTGC